MLEKACSVYKMKYQHQSNSVNIAGDEITLADLWKLGCAGWRLIVGALLIAWLAAGIYLAMVPSQYEATVLARVGQVGVAGVARDKQVGMVAWPQQIEDDAGVILRMGGTEFRNAVLDSLGWKEDERGRLLQNSYQISNSASRHLKIKVRGLTANDARQAAVASLAVLADIHKGLSEKIGARISRELSKVESDIADSEAFLRSMDQSAQGKVRSGSDMAAANVLKIIKDERSNLRELYALQHALKEAMGPDLTTPTMAVEPVVVSDMPVYPKERGVWFFATAVGFLLGVFLVTLRSISHMNRNAALPPPADQ
ncbi:MAG TPA: hypothetical protein PLW86_00235 [Rhodocyclaceae bacterium]|nr:hypothetical protein [Rhodocyclaceae bacterium]